MTTISDALKIIKTDLIPTTDEEKKFIKEKGIQAFRLQKLQRLIEQKRTEEKDFLSSFEESSVTISDERKVTDLKDPHLENAFQVAHQALILLKQQKKPTFQ